MVDTVTGSAGIQWTSVTAVVFSSYIRIVSVWHTLAYSFALGMVVAVSGTGAHLSLPVHVFFFLRL
jgi:hypothetical protein